VTESEAQFELVEFEQVEAAPGTALLRIAARPSARMGSGALTLVITDGTTEHRHEQLPALPGPPGLIRAAFSAPLGHAGPRATYSLALPDGETVRLPAPARRRSALGATAGTASGSAATPPVGEPATEEGEPSRLVEAERRAESRRLAISELERRLQSERERRSAAESDLAYLRSERDEARAERDAALADRDEAVADRDQAEARARAAAANAGTLEAQIRAAADTATRAQAALEAQLADRASELERIRTAAELAQARAHASRREVTSLDEQLAHAQAQISVLQQALDEYEAERESAAAAMDDAVSAARAETASARERVVALEDELGSVRDLASRSDDQHEYDLETVQARLDVAHAEIEVARTEAEASHHKNGELEATLVEFDAALAARAAEIELLRAAVAEAGGQPGAAAAGFSGREAGAEPIGPELEARLAEARAEASGALLAEVELLRTQLHEYGERTEAAETELERVRAAASLVADELKAASDNAGKAHADAEMYERRASELGTTLSSAERTLHDARDALAAHETKNRELSDAVRSETEKRIRAEEALVAASAQHALTTESLALEAGRQDA
jgi:chromosome segregation ATPase